MCSSENVALVVGAAFSFIAPRARAEIVCVQVP
jgi:hypothetical protein